MRTLEEPRPSTLRPPASLTAFIKHGGWFCQRCERVVNLPLDLDEPGRCPHCKKPTCKYHPPVKELLACAAEHQTV